MQVNRLAAAVAAATWCVSTCGVNQAEVVSDQGPDNAVCLVLPAGPAAAGVADVLSVIIGSEMLKIVPGRVSTEVRWCT
jgi:hypothetical protein